MKTRILRKLVVARQFANSEKGERAIVFALSTLTGMLALIVLAFIVNASL
jgi:hypothetical protein